MRIGILTHHYVKNYGAFLQMKGMYETLQRLYPEAEVTVINYVNQKHWRRNILHILCFIRKQKTLHAMIPVMDCRMMWHSRPCRNSLK